MSNISVKLLLVAAVVSTLSCKKQTDNQVKLSTVTSSLTISSIKQLMSQQMTGQVYNDLDWQNASISSLDADHQGDMMQVTSKSNFKTSLYYSVLNGTISAYLVTLNLPNKMEKDNDVDGYIEVRSVKNQLLRKFTIKNNKVVVTVSYNNSGFADPPDTIAKCDGCTLPTVMVTVSLSGGGHTTLSSMFYTYGGGIGAFIATTPGSYGSGGSNSNPYYDKYNSKSDPTARRNIFLDKNLNYARKYYAAQVTKYGTYTQFKVVDNKTFWYFNVELNFQLDLKNQLIPNMTSVNIIGIIPGSYVIKTPQNPAPQYGSGVGTMTFGIDGAYSYGIGSFNVPISVNVKGIGTTSVWASLTYGGPPMLPPQ